MPLDPQIEGLVTAMAAQPRTALDDTTVGDLRAGFPMLVQMMAGAAPDLHRREDRTIPGPHGDIALRIAWPRDAQGLPIVVFLHGGGWCIGSAAAYDPLTAQLAVGADAIVVAVDYRLAPEHPFPVPYDECYAALEWAVANADALGGDASRVALWGDSAGGNLSAACALRARDGGGPQVAMQVLVYPVTDCDLDRPSYRDNGEGYFLERTAMEYFWASYTRHGVDPADPRLSVLRAADLAGLPPAVVITAEYDPLRDEGDALAHALAAAGVEVEHTRYDGVIHGFAMMGGMVTKGAEALAQTVGALRRAFGA